MVLQKNLYQDHHMQKFPKRTMPVYYTETCKLDFYVLFIYLFNFAKQKTKLQSYAHKIIGEGDHHSLASHCTVDPLLIRINN